MNKFKHPPQKPSKPYTYTPQKPSEFYPAPNIKLGQYSNGLKLADLKLPVGVSLDDLLFDTEIEYDYDDSHATIIVSYPSDDQVKNQYYAAEMKFYDGLLKENEQREAIYKAQMKIYRAAKKEYDAFWAEQEQQ
jgi:hypothetical protein